NFEASATEVFAGEEIVLTNFSLGANAYTWELNNETFNTTNLNYTFSEAGNYLVRLLSSNEDCNAVKEQYIEVLNKTTGIAEQIALDRVVVYTKDNSIIIDLSNADLEGRTDLEVYDVLGQLIVQKLNVAEIESIEMAKQARGYYFVHVVNQNEQVSKKVFVK
ncbi:MAG: T9SS type A sorting domain-containing protein, partial [Bacteroidetes bacterium]|nr:T9SS type A sorting domain-containing protein [Bacteroidota bacterium]